MYATTDAEQARSRLDTLYEHCRRADIPELTRLSRTIRRWQPQVLASHATALTNGPTEAVSLLKKVKRVGHGFRNFENYRLRLLLHCGV